VRSTPDFDREETNYSWAVEGNTKSGKFQLSLEGKDMTTPITVAISKLISTNLNDEGEVWFGGQPISREGIVFFRGRPMDVELKPRPDSPIEGYPISLTRKVNSPLQHNDLSSAPRFDPFERTHKWSVTGANRSGIFELKMTGQGMTTPITVTDIKLLSTRLGDEVEVKIGEQDIPPGGAVFFRGQAKLVELKPRLGSPIAGHRIALTRQVTSLPLQHNDLSSAPRFDPFEPNLQWRVTGANRSGSFELKMTGQDMTTPITVSGNRLLSTNLANEATPLFDGRAIPTGEVFVGGVTKVLTLDYTGPLRGVPLRLNWVPKDGLVINDVSSTPPRNSDTTTHRWDIVCAEYKTGTFDLELSAGDNNEAKLLIPGNRLFPNAVSFRFVKNTDGEYHPLPPETVVAFRNTPYAIAARLLTLDGEPLQDKKVTFRVPGSAPSESVTNENGFTHPIQWVIFKELGVNEVYADADIEGTVERVTMLVEVKNLSISE